MASTFAPLLASLLARDQAAKRDCLWRLPERLPTWSWPGDCQFRTVPSACWPRARAEAPPQPTLSCGRSFSALRSQTRATSAAHRLPVIAGVCTHRARRGTASMRLLAGRHLRIVAIDCPISARPLMPPRGGRPMGAPKRAGQINCSPERQQNGHHNEGPRQRRASPVSNPLWAQHEPSFGLRGAKLQPNSSKILAKFRPNAHLGGALATPNWTANWTLAVRSPEGQPDTRMGAPWLQTSGPLAHETVSRRNSTPTRQPSFWPLTTAGQPARPSLRSLWSWRDT